MSLDERLREGLEGLDTLEGAPPEGVVDAVLGRGRRTRRIRRLTAGAVALAAAIAAFVGAPTALDALRSTDDRRPAAPEGGRGLISTVAGTGFASSSGDGGPATEASISHPSIVGFDADGNLYLNDAGGRVRKIDPSGVITTVAGPPAGGEPAPGEAGTAKGNGLAVDAQGNVYVGTEGTIVRVTPSGDLTTIAGTGREGFSGDGGPAISARISLDYAAMAIDAEGNLYLGQPEYHRVRRIDTNGIITTIAGTGEPGFSGDGGPARKAELYGPTTITADGSGYVYISDTGIEVRAFGHRIRRIDTNGIITTVAGNGERGFPDDGAVATSVPIGGADVYADAEGNIYITDEAYPGIFKVNPEGILTILAGTGVDGYSGDGGPAPRAKLSEPTSVAIGPDGDLYIADWGNNRIRRVDLEAQGYSENR